MFLLINPQEKKLIFPKYNVNIIKPCLAKCLSRFLIVKMKTPVFC